MTLCLNFRLKEINEEMLKEINEERKKKCLFARKSALNWSDLTNKEKDEKRHVFFDKKVKKIISVNVFVNTYPKDTGNSLE